MELTPYSKDGHRPLSSFHAEEMLYEYAQGILDKTRTQALEDYLKTDPEMQTELQRIRRGLGYLEELSSFRTSVESLERIRTSNSFTDRVVEKLRIDDWPVGLKLGIESIAVVSTIFVIAIAVPWNNLFEVIQNEASSVTLAELRREPKVPTTEVADATLMEMVKDVVFDDEGVPDSPFKTSKDTVDEITNVPQISVAKNEGSQKDSAAASAKPADGASTANVAAVQKRAASSVDDALTAGTGAALIPAATDETSATAKTAANSKRQDPILYQGYLYRGRLEATNVEAITPKLVEYVNREGGRKAGQVPLGWQKGQGSYFHFTIPEAKYEELENFFREYGTLVISKERHERVMPEGIIRLIVEVEEKKP